MEPKQQKPKGISPESAFELQLIDCNCNDCGFLQRIKEIKCRWDYFHKELDHKAYTEEKSKASYALYDAGVRGIQLTKVANAKFAPIRKSPINYGLCKKLAMIYFDVLKRERLAVWMMDYASDYLVTLATLLSTSLKSTFTPLSYFLTSSWSDNPLD